jgi:hypothetical protein
MAAPLPPQGNQTPHTERPLKVYAEQYLDGQPLPIGVVIDPPPPPGAPPLFSDGLPRVLLPAGWVVVQPTDWVISNRYSGQPVEVLSHEEMAERFGLPDEEG